MTSVLLVAESDGYGSITQPSLEAIVAANQLIDSCITVVIAGDLSESASSLSVDRVVKISEIDTSDIGVYEQATADIASVVNSINPEGVHFCKSDFGSLVGARVAFRIGAAFAADCTEISNPDGSVIVTRPVFGGSALAEYEITTSQPVITLSSGAFLIASE